MNLKISVIIPVYNIQEYIEECIASVQRQTLKELEIICVDDGSEDDSLLLIQRRQKTDDRIKVIAQSNQGAGKARNNALNQARGEFVFFLDGDDYLLEVTALEKLYAACINHQVMICGGLLNCQRQGTLVSMGVHRELCEKYPEGKKLSYRDYQYDYYYIAYLYQRKMLIENQIFFPSYKRFQDPPFFVNAMLVAGEFYVLPVELYCIRSGHQDYAFSNSKVNDIVRGITDILVKSSENNLRKLHLLEVSRLNEGFFWHIVKSATLENLILLQLLIEANQAVNWEWVNEDGKDGQSFLKALRFIVSAVQEKSEKITQKEGETILTGMVFPFHKIPQNSKVVLYAAGMVGWAYYEQIKNHKDYELVGWVDQQYEKFKGGLPEIKSVKNIYAMEFDYLVIAIEDRNLALDIKNSLIKNGIPKEKIVWSLSI